MLGCGVGARGGGELAGGRVVSRCGYSDDLDNLELGRWRGQVESALRGKRGQRFLRDLIDALDALPQKRLVKNELEEGGEVCALGALGKARGVALDGLDTYDYEQLGSTFDIAHQLAQETMYVNDDYGSTPEQRWKMVRDWAEEHLAFAAMRGGRR